MSHRSIKTKPGCRVVPLTLSQGAEKEAVTSFSEAVDGYKTFRRAPSMSISKPAAAMPAGLC